MASENSAFACRQCGHCCEGEGGIILASKDQIRLADHLGLTLDAFLERFSRPSGDKAQLDSRPDGFCIFFDQGCTVHPARPDICRAWPFFRGNLLDASSWELSLEYCPGINPKVSHETFAREGLNYLQENALGHDGDTDAPNALCVKGIPRS